MNCCIAIYHKDCDTCDSKKAKTPVHTRVCARERRWLWRFSQFLFVHSSLINWNNTSFYEKPHVVWCKTTRRFMKNHTSFYEKPHVVWCKTTRRFMKNHTSFYEKPHVVLWKTSRRFMKNHTSFYVKPHVVLWKTTRRFLKTSAHLWWLSKRTIYARYVRGHGRWSMSHSKTSRMSCKK